MKKIIISGLSLLSTAALNVLYGQKVEALSTAGKGGDPFFDNTMTIVLVAAFAGVAVTALAIMVKINGFLSRRLMEIEADRHGITLPHAAEGQKGDDFFTRLRKKYWEDAVPIDREHEITFHHAYDGIRELDNRLPPWWVNMFVITVVWAVGYMWYYHWGGDGPSSIATYEADVAAAKKERAAALAGLAAAVDENSVTLLADTRALGEGELIYKNLCAACHGQKGEGGVGPNFTDEYWIHGGGIKDLFRTVKYGVPEKGMISWESQLKPADIQKVSSYILSLKGTNPPNQKAPQGQIWTEAAAKDTVKTDPVK